MNTWRSQSWASISSWSTYPTLGWRSSRRATMGSPLWAWARPSPTGRVTCTWTARIWTTPRKADNPPETLIFIRPSSQPISWDLFVLHVHWTVARYLHRLYYLSAHYFESDARGVYWLNLVGLSFPFFSTGGELPGGAACPCAVRKCFGRGNRGKVTLALKAM